MSKHHRTKGQAISLDWLTGLSLFMIAIVSTTFIVINNGGPTSQTDLRSQAEELSQTLQDETEVTARKNTLHVQGPHEIDNIPVDKEYNFPVDANSGVMETPSEINESGNSVITVIETGNKSYELTYFFEELEEIEHENDIVYDGTEVRNSNISFIPTLTGLESLRINENELLNDEAYFEDAGTTFEEGELHAEVGKLNIYNGSRELILEEPEASFYLENFTDLYWGRWGEDGVFRDLTGTGEFEEGETPGFTLATTPGGEDRGLTFVGDLEASVSKPEDSVVRADINGSRVRILLHDTDYREGQRRIEFHEKGDMYFGAEHEVSGVYPNKTKELESMGETEFEDQFHFENRFNLGSYGYNISMLEVERGLPLPFQDVVAHNREAAVMGRHGDLSNTTIKVRLWR